MDSAAPPASLPADISDDMSASGAVNGEPDWTLLADHGVEPSELKGLTYPLGDTAPEYSTVFPLLPDIGWTRLPVPGNLNHINIWLLDDDATHENGYAIADTGLFMPDAIASWKALFAGPLKDKELTRILVTHFHPDHIGCAGWLANKFKVKIWMNRTEWLMARMLTSDVQDMPPAEAIALRKFNGYSEERLAKFASQGWGNFARAVSRLPISHKRIDDGDIIRVGKRQWHAITGGGHTPEHCSFVDHHNGVIIAGDQILPRITSNVSLMDAEPDSDPLGEWLASIDKFKAALADDMLVLPAHGHPFTGVQRRLDRLAEGHHERLDILAAELKQRELRATDCFDLLFDREITDNVYGLAAGEAMAHLRHLERIGQAQCETRDGVGWFSAA